MEKLKHFLSLHSIAYVAYIHETVVTIEDVERVLKIPKTAMVKSLVVKVHDTIYIAAVSGNQRLEEKRVYCGFGSLTESIMMSPEDIARISKAIVADITESEVN